MRGKKTPQLSANQFLIDLLIIEYFSSSLRSSPDCSLLLSPAGRCSACIPFVGGRWCVCVCYHCLWQLWSVSPAGSELLQELHSSQSRVVQPAAGLPVVPVRTACQFPTSPHIPAWTKWQVTATRHMMAPSMPAFKAFSPLFAVFVLSCVKSAETPRAIKNKLEFVERG